MRRTRADVPFLGDFGQTIFVDLFDDRLREREVVWGGGTENEDGSGISMGEL